jgi:hypothetical protein
MEVNSSYTLFKILGELAFANLIHVYIIRKSAALMEFSEECIEFIDRIVHNKFVPEAAC